MVNSKKFNYKEGINIVIENNIFSKNKDKDGNPKGKGMGGGTPNNFIPPSIRQPQTMPDIDTLVSPFVEKMRADMMAKNFYGRRFNEFNPYDNLLTNGGHHGFQNNNYGNPMIENMDDDEDEEEEEPQQQEQEQNVAEGEQEQDAEEEQEPAAPVPVPEVVLFDKDGKYTKRMYFKSGKPTKQYMQAERKRSRLLDNKRGEAPSEFEIIKYGLQDFYH